MGAPLPPMSQAAQGHCTQTHAPILSWSKRGAGMALKEGVRPRAPPLVRMHHALRAGALAQAQKEGMDTAGLRIPPCLLVVSSRKCST